MLERLCFSFEVSLFHTVPSFLYVIDNRRSFARRALLGN
nr:PH23-38 [Vibrio phage 1]